MKFITSCLAVLVFFTLAESVPVPQQQNNQQPGDIFASLFNNIPLLPNLLNMGGGGGGAGATQGQSNQGGSEQQNNNNNPLNALTQVLNPANALQGFQKIFQG